MYVQQPTGFNDGSGRVCRLRRSLYGLKQAPRIWQQKAANVLKASGFSQLKNDPNLYVKRNDNGVVILLIWIDDVLSGASLNAAGATILKELVVVLKEQFKIRELGLVTKFIGLHVTQDLSSGTITIDQKLYYIM